MCTKQSMSICQLTPAFSSKGQRACTLIYSMQWHQKKKSVTSDPQCTVRCQQTRGSLLSAGNTFGHTASVAAAQIRFQTTEHHPHQTKPALQLMQLMVRLNKLFKIFRHMTSHCLLWTCQFFFLYFFLLRYQLKSVCQYFVTLVKKFSLHFHFFN